MSDAHTIRTHLNGIKGLALGAREALARLEQEAAPPVQGELAELLTDLQWVVEQAQALETLLERQTRKEGDTTMEVKTVAVAIRYSAQLNKSGAWKTVELTAEGTMAPADKWQEAQQQLYQELTEQMRQIWAAAEAGAGT